MDIVDLHPIENRSRCDAAAEVAYDMQCPLCSSAGSVFAFDQRRDIDGRICEIAQCANCSILLNETDLSRLNLQDHSDEFLQAFSSDQFYAVDPDFLENLSRHIDSNKLVEFLLEQVPEAGRTSLMDFGAGRGITAAAAAKHFSRVYAVELTLDVLRVVHSVMPMREKITIASDLADVPSNLDAIVSMHVFEHLPNFREMFITLLSKLKPDGLIFFQVPLLRNDYIIKTHYMFFNKRAVHSLARLHRADVIGVWFDNNRDFLTAIIRKRAI